MTFDEYWKGLFDSESLPTNMEDNKRALREAFEAGQKSLPESIEKAAEDFKQVVGTNSGERMFDGLRKFFVGD